MPPSTASVVNHWFDRKCARAFWSQRDLGPYQELLRDTAAWLDPAAGERWLDLGCGSGQLTRTVWEKSGGRAAQVVAVDCADVNDDAIGRIRSAATPPAPEGRIVFRQADFSDGLGAFDDASFDGAVSGLAIQYAQHYDAALGRWTTAAYDNLLREVRRVLRPGGRFVFSVNVPRPAWLRIAVVGAPAFFRSRHPLRFFRNSMRMLRYGRWLKQEAARGRFHYLPADTVGAKLRQAGFERVEHRLSFSRQAYLFRAYRPA
jgi:ubiquinone/menaquinone biosynthesis C-methylase UbiE